MEKILVLSNNDNVQYLCDRLKHLGEYHIQLCHNQVTLPVIKEIMPDFVISYNYQYIIREDVIDYMGDRIINLHISFLPWNKGSDPNIWSFLDDTPKGVTIHRLERGLDGGKIIVQKEVSFDENVETLATSYERLNREIVNLLVENWDMIFEGNYSAVEQMEKGSYHRRADLIKRLNGKTIDYSMTIAEFKKFITEQEKRI